MSNYPPPPTFGIPFNPNGDMEMAAGSDDQGLSQYSYTDQGSSFRYGQSQTNGMSTLPHTKSNTHSFHSNAQGMTTSSSENEWNGSPFALYGGQFQHSAFQNSAYPPTLSAPSATSYGAARPFGQSLTVSDYPPNTRTNIPNVHFTPAIQNAKDRDSDKIPPALSELEDGELDDEEVGEAIDLSRASATTPSGASQHKRHENVDSEFNYRVTNAANKPLPGLAQGSYATPNSQDSTTSQPQQYSMPDGSIDDSEVPQSSRVAESTSIQHQLSANTTAQEIGELNVIQKMEDAKQALRDLHSQGFDFNQLVNAGLNPRILRCLYTKIEVPPAPSSGLLQRKIARSETLDVPTESTPGAASEGVRGGHPNPLPKSSNGDFHDNDDLPKSVKTNNEPTVVAAKSEGKATQNQASLAKSSKYPSLNSLGKTSGVKIGETKVVDRKEYIARMLAAKASKPPVTSISVSSETPTITDSGAAAQVQSSATAAARLPVTVQQAPSELVSGAVAIQNEEPDVEAKRKAQTHLARQKIEALKLRESFQQARSPISSVATRSSQLDLVDDVSNKPAESSVPAPRPLPSRQSSYFSPASQKPPFSIPGLFMSSDAPEPTILSQPSANESITVLSQAIGHTTFASSQENLGPHASVPAVDQRSNLPETSFDLMSALPMTNSNTLTTTSNRKRQKASDFIDSPSTRVKRPLGQQEDTSVIIDISDDEVSNDISADEFLGTEDIEGSRKSLPRKTQVNTLDNGKEKPVKILPPLTEFPQRTKSVMITAPTAQVSGQGVDFKGLKLKEMEIEVINRKIAELEQRMAIKARQTMSRNHSPGTSSLVTVSPCPGEAPHQIVSARNVSSSVSNSQDNDATHVETRKSFNALAETRGNAAGEQLNAKQQLVEVERAKAEAELSLAAENTLASAVNQSQEENVRNPQKEEQSIPREAEQRLKDEGQKLFVDEEERRLEESQSQQYREGEAKKLRQEEADRHLREQEQRLAQAARQERLEEQELKRSLDDRRLARKSEIESGLPLLDAEVERTSKRLEFLREEMAGLETQLQKGIEGRQGLVAELNSLSRSKEATPGPMDLDSGDIPKQLPNTEDISAATRHSASAKEVPKLGPVQLSGSVRIGREVPEKSPSMQITNHQVSDRDFEEDVMDVSRSDVNEAELSLYSPKEITDIQNTSGSADDDENYEPPGEINIAHTRKSIPDDAPLYPELGIEKGDLPAEMQNQSFAKPNASSEKKSPLGEWSPTASLNLADNEHPSRSLSASSSLANASDSDDYEPPEPAPLGEEVPRVSHKSSVSSERAFSPPDVETNLLVASTISNSIPTVNQEVQKLDYSRSMGHFTPYDSPLKQFKSFRYHPQYLEEVSSGFRSLTYSHTINPNIPLCRYELDGVCNDDSCQRQHLRSVGLSDDKILVDLGAKPDDGSSPDEFGNGLREVIHDIRSRKIKDFNVVAGEITAFRAKFLGDSSKVLPL